MKGRHILFLIGIAAILAAVIVGCSVAGATVSVTQRITDFQSDLNSSGRTTIYEDFHPTMTSDYNALKDPTTTIDSVIPPLGTSDPAYVLTVTDDTYPATGVFVTITGGPVTFGAPQYLKLVMAVTGTADYRIVSLALSNTAGSFPTTQIQ